MAQKFKFRPGEKPIITVDLPKAPQGSQTRRGEIAPYIEPEYPGRRGGSFIEFYDLGQVSGDGVVFTDHPILKAPSYSVSFEVSSPGDTDGTALYNIEGFDNADYQAYTDMFFDVPLEEWHQRYKKLDYEAPLDAFGTAAYTDYPSYITLLNKEGEYGAVMRPSPEQSVPISVFALNPMIDPLTHSDPPSYASAMLAAVGMAWYNSPKMKVKGLTEIEAKRTINAEGRGPSFFPFSTSDKTVYKVTATNDPDAADVGVIAPSGLTRIFMMPQIVCWAAVTASSDLLTRHVLGPVYQITPRRYWPRYVDREWYHHDGSFSVGLTSCFGVIDDPDDRKKDFFEYQMARGGMQASSWTRASLSDLFTDSTFSGANSPTLWPSTNDNYASQTFTSSSNEGLFDSGGADNPYRGDTSFMAGSPGVFFSSSDPFLCAVIQKGSTFYYVWMLPDEHKPEDYAGAQGNKYRLTLRQDDIGVATYDDATIFGL